ncbi:MAG: hypothetical protein ACNYZH_03705 [Acidimicrobiia bacterium]
MKRMTLLTALALVFSLFAVTAAIAAPGVDAGEGDQDRDCRVVDGVSDCDFDRDRIQAETNAPSEEQPETKEQVQNQNQNQNQDGECEAEDCQSGEMTQTQTQTRLQEPVGECQADDCPAEDALKAQNQIQERLMNRILEMVGAESAEVEGQYRLILNVMLQNMLRFRVLFI